MPLTQKSFTKGSEFPALSKGTLRLYSMRFCPYAQRTRLVLEHKGIPYETVNVDLKNKPDWFLERNPLGLVPTLEQDDKIVCESLVTCDYLDEVYPNNRLTPADPYRKARDAMLIDFFGNKFTPNYYKILRSDGKDNEAKEELTKTLQRLDNELKARGAYFGGEKVALIDLNIWPWFERLILLENMAPELQPSESNHTAVFAWIKAMLQQPAVKATGFDAQTHSAFLKSYLNNKPNYDIGLEP